MTKPALTDAEAVGQRFLKERTGVGMTQVALAEVTGIPQTTISGIERGAEVSLRNATLIADALGIDLDDLASPFRPNSRRRPQLKDAAA